MADRNLLQDVLKDSTGSAAVTCYPLGDVTDLLTLSHADLYNQAQENGAKIRNIPGFEKLQPILLHFDTHLNTIIWF